VRQAEAARPQGQAGRPGQRHRPASARSAKAVDADLAALERQLGDMLGLKVKVAHKGPGRHGHAHYSSLDQLDMICQRLSGEPI
jgi:ParB family chromosome partitioning protein